MQSAILLIFFKYFHKKTTTLQYISYVETFLYLVYSKINLKTYISIEPIILHNKKSDTIFKTCKNTVVS